LEEEEIQCSEITYNEVTFKKQGIPFGRIIDENRAQEEARKKEKEEVEKEASPLPLLHNQD
jgi:hypothetical protein